MAETIITQWPDKQALRWTLHLRDSPSLALLQLCFSQGYARPMLLGLGLHSTVVVPLTCLLGMASHEFHPIPIEPE